MARTSSRSSGRMRSSASDGTALELRFGWSQIERAQRRGAHRLAATAAAPGRALRRRPATAGAAAAAAVGRERRRCRPRRHRPAASARRGAGRAPRAAAPRTPSPVAWPRPPSGIAKHRPRPCARRGLGTRAGWPTGQRRPWHRGSGTAAIGSRSASASPLTVLTAIRSPVKEPGPTATARPVEVARGPSRVGEHTIHRGHQALGVRDADVEQVLRHEPFAIE